MPLHRLKDYYPDYRETMADGQMDKISSYSVYTEGEDKVGTAKDLLVDDAGHFRYLVVDTGPWIFGKNVLLPIGLAKFDYQKTHIYVDGLTKSQVEHLPEYDDNMVVDEPYENRLREVYKPMAQNRSTRQFMGNSYTVTDRQSETLAGDLRRMPPLGNTATITDPSREGDLRRMGPIDGRDRRPVERTHRTASHPEVYDLETGFYGLSEEDNHGPLLSYEERLWTQRDRG